MTAAGAGDAARADLPLLGDELAQRRDVLVVDLVDLVAAERAGLAPPAAGSASLLTPPGRFPAVPLLRQSPGPSSSRSLFRARVGASAGAHSGRQGRDQRFRVAGTTPAEAPRASAQARNGWRI